MSGTSSVIGLNGNLIEYLSPVNSKSSSKFWYIASSLVLTPTDSISQIVDNLWSVSFSKTYLELLGGTNKKWLLIL